MRKKVYMEVDDSGAIDNPLQTLMARTGSFPLRVPYRLLERHASGQTVVLDPFCGKGTTLLAARMLGHVPYGMDVAPEAVMCSLAKLVDVSLTGIEGYISGLPRLPSRRLRHATDTPQEIRCFFHPGTLAQLLATRDQLTADMESDDTSVRADAIFSMGCLLGVLHGHSSFSLSISSSHAFAMSPAYVSRYAAAHGLKAPPRDVRACLLEKASRCLRVPVRAPASFDVKVGSALVCSEVFPELTDKVDIIITSPPYLNAQTYAKDNWLRLWLLGYEYRSLRAQYIQTGSVRRYQEQMREVFMELARMLKPGGQLVCVAGDVRLGSGAGGEEANGVFKTGNVLADLCVDDGIGLRVLSRQVQIVPSHRRYLNSLSSANGHTKRDLVERTFVAEKIQE